MLSARLCTRILNPANGLLHGDAVEVPVAANALPVPSALRKLCQRSAHGTEDDVDPHRFRLLTNAMATGIHQASIPCQRRLDTRWESSNTSR
jgi:hypothetical protein